jgi:catechol 2,3-dioxygenase-like lactoylglutathione lyase family enzyme
VLHHTALEVRPDAVREETAFWTAIGFGEVPVPAALGDGYTWLERSGTQIHLMPVERPVVPGRGHVAVVVPYFSDTVDRLREFGSTVSEGRELWGAKRAKALSPAGHTVELMAAPPPPAEG